MASSPRRLEIRESLQGYPSIALSLGIIVKNVKLGQAYRFTRADISDWMYMADGTMQGNYTLRVELESMPPKQAEAIAREIGW